MWLHWQREKELQIDEALRSSLVDVEALRRHAVSMGGLFHSDIRRRVWPKLVGVNMYHIKPYEGAPLTEHKDRAQVLLDVRRCSRRIPEHYSETRRQELQEKLLRVILRLLSEHPDLHYYQGFHDIVITFLLVGGEDFAYAIVNVLVQHHIRDFMDADMDRTKVIICYLRPLLRLESRTLERFIHKSECAYYFCLSWLITWFGHVVRRLDEACRLVDFLLASHPLMPVYLSGAVRENAHTHTHTTTQTHFKLFLD
ncbi:TBC1 domain family member 20 [Geodia barretti]|uniref:TBC1 domain family member 20 n=1 Tax=Geodia barretti TaxID=519541 RepID=A0AA35RD13_GEOBA|nr:TBC1 domain family member 20 [Geodia barretti]